MMSFEEALEKQRQLQKNVYGIDLGELEGDARKDAVRTHVLALLDEVHEVLHEADWKPWKKTSQNDSTAYAEEMVDAFHFFMNLMLIGGMSVEDLLEGYSKKHDENIDRQNNGY